MKSKIIEIAEKSGYQEGFRWAMEDFDMERFAELIIKECQRACDTYINDCGEVNGVPDSVFKTHFGIE